eukprot:12197125-Ditylum_brightwellii.AAC.1
MLAEICCAAGSKSAMQKVINNLKKSQVTQFLSSPTILAVAFNRHLQNFPFPMQLQHSQKIF